MYPRVETIVIPDAVPLELVGAYATHAATKVINDAGKATVNPKSFSLKPLHPKIWVLSFECVTPYSVDAEMAKRFKIFENIEVIEDDNREKGEKEVVHVVRLSSNNSDEGSVLPVSNEKRSSKVNTNPRGAK